MNSDRGVTAMAEPPPHNPIVAGAWWPKDYAGEPLISLTKDIADGFGVTGGDTLTLNLMGREVTARIAT